MGCFYPYNSTPTKPKRCVVYKTPRVVRKDVERAFGVLQARFAIIQRPSLIWDQDLIWEIILACIILHNMIVEDECDTYRNYKDTTEFEQDNIQYVAEPSSQPRNTTYQV